MGRTDGWMVDARNRLSARWCFVCFFCDTVRVIMHDSRTRMPTSARYMYHMMRSLAESRGRPLIYLYPIQSRFILYLPIASVHTHTDTAVAFPPPPDHPRTSTKLSFGIFPSTPVGFSPVAVILKWWRMSPFSNPKSEITVLDHHHQSVSGVTRFGGEFARNLLVRDAAGGAEKEELQQSAIFCHNYGGR